mgnify:CR=1 FL=1
MLYFLQSYFGAKVAIIGFLMFSYDLLARSRWADLWYRKILAVRGRGQRSRVSCRGSELRLLKVHKNWASSISGPTTCHFLSVATNPYAVWKTLLTLFSGGVDGRENEVWSTDVVGQPVSIEVNFVVDVSPPVPQTVWVAPQWEAATWPN